MSAEVQWDDLRCLDALVREKTFGAAARQLGISSSPLYRRIAALKAATSYAGFESLNDVIGAVSRNFQFSLSRSRRRTSHSLCISATG